jgi:hypothetical protein
MAIMAVRPVALGRSDCDRIPFRLIVGEVIPGVTAFTVVLAHRPPLALTEVRSPLLPGNFLVLSRLKSGVFGSQGIVCCHCRGLELDFYVGGSSEPEKRGIKPPISPVAFGL